MNIINRRGIAWLSGIARLIRPGGRRRAAGRQWLIPLAVLAGLSLVAAHYARDRGVLQARLLTTDPDGIAADHGLQRYAISIGRPAFQDHCASCHGRNLRGDTMRGIPNLADGDWLYGTGRVGEIERVILYGIRSGHPKAWNLASMPAFATPNPYQAYSIAPLTPHELGDVVAYVYGLRHPAADPAAAARGSHVFHKTGLCFDCHGEDARGDPAIGAPDLTDAVWLYGDGTPPSIATSIAHGLAGACPPWIGKLRPATIRAIAVYVNAAAGGRSAQERSHAG
jgi:cytochrome c oxidase cbb3-type subunit 3